MAEISFKKIIRRDLPFVTREIMMVETVGCQMEEGQTEHQEPPANPPTQQIFKSEHQAAGTIFVLPSQQQVNYNNFTKTTDMPEVY